MDASIPERTIQKILTNDHPKNSLRTAFAALCCTGIQGTESSAVDSEASIAENRMLYAVYFVNF